MRGFAPRAGGNWARAAPRQQRHGLYKPGESLIPRPWPRQLPLEGRPPSAACLPPGKPHPIPSSPTPLPHMPRPAVCRPATASRCRKQSRGGDGRLERLIPAQACGCQPDACSRAAELGLAARALRRHLCIQAVQPGSAAAGGGVQRRGRQGAAADGPCAAPAVPVSGAGLHALVSRGMQMPGGHFCCRWTCYLTC